MQNMILNNGTRVYSQRGNASRAKRSLSMRQRPEIQEVLRGGDCTAADEAPVRNLHGVLRWVGGREYPRSRDEGRSALTFPRSRLMHDLRAEAGRALPQLRLRL